MADNLLLLKVMETNGTTSRDVIVLDTITFYNLHRCLQYCVKPRQSDSTVDGKAFSFQSTATKKAIKGPKTAQLCGTNRAKVGDCYTYEADGKKFRVEVVDRHKADGRHYVPRCIGGSNGPAAAAADLDATNGKLLVRRFSKRGVGQIKKPPPILAHASESNAQLCQSQLSIMRCRLRWEEELLADFEPRQFLQLPSAQGQAQPAKTGADRPRLAGVVGAAGAEHQPLAAAALVATPTPAEQQPVPAAAAAATAEQGPEALQQGSPPPAAAATAAVAERGPEALQQQSPAAVTAEAAAEVQHGNAAQGRTPKAADTAAPLPLAVAAPSAAPVLVDLTLAEGNAAAAKCTSSKTAERKPASKAAKAATSSNSIMKYFARQNV